MQKQRLQQKLGQNLSAQQIQFLSLLQIPLQGLDSRVQEELEENPALEECEDDINTTDLNSEDSQKSFFKNDNSNDNPNSLQILFEEDDINQHLKKQLILLNLNEKDQFLTEYLIDSLDDNGWINAELYSIVDDLKINLDLDFSETEVNEALLTIQTLDPCGVGARNLKECLILQLKKKNNYEDKIIQLCIRILEDEYESFSKKNFDGMIKRLEISEKELKDVYLIIEKLNPFPILGFNNTSRPEYINPDFSVRLEGDELIATLTRGSGRSLTVSSHYQDLIKKTSDKKAREFLKQKLEQARWFIDAIIKRESTLLKVMNAILSIQKDYFKSGDEKDLKPMKLDDVALIVNMDRSTISRVSNSKYVETFFGTMLLKDLFSQAYRKDNGDVISTRIIKQQLKEIIENEDKRNPYTDNHLCDLLGQEEYHIARRTVTKYRESLGIETSRYRKQL